MRPDQAIMFSAAAGCRALPGLSLRHVTAWVQRAPGPDHGRDGPYAGTIAAQMAVGLPPAMDLGPFDPLRLRLRCS